MNHPLHILWIGNDSEQFARLIGIIEHEMTDLFTYRHTRTVEESLQLTPPENFHLLLFTIARHQHEDVSLYTSIQSLYKDLPILIITDSPDRITIEKYISLGAVDVLDVKNLSSYLLMKCFHHALFLYHSQKESASYALKLKINEERLIEAQRIAHIGNFELDLNDHSFYWSEEIYFMFLQDKSIRPGIEIYFKYVHPHDLQRVRSVLRESLKLEHDFDLDHRIVISKNNVRWINIRGQFHYEIFSKQKKVIGTIQDITNRKLIEEERDKFFNQSNDLLCIATVEGYFKRINPAFTITLGHSEAELLSKPFIEFVHPDDVEPTLKILSHVSKGSPTIHFENRYRCSDGNYKWIAWRSTTDAESGLIYASARDITDSKKNEQLIKAKEVAERSAKMKEQFLAQMSHEIRSPMNVISGMTHLMMKTTLDEEQQRYMNAVKTSSDHMLSLISDILDFSKIEAGKIQFDKTEFSIADLIGNLIDTLIFKAEEKNILLITQIDPLIPGKILGDPIRLSQILLNLIGNSLKFTNQGKITIDVRVIDQEDNTATISFTVHDTGIGISEEELPTIFGSFTQGRTPQIIREGGTGLGLAISKQLVELQGGSIVAESQLGVGSSFRFMLKYFKPRYEKKYREVITESEFVPADIGAINILLVDDKPLNLVLAEEIVKKWWPLATIAKAKDGKEAVALAMKNNYDIILMDVLMPEMDGYEATRQIRANADPPKNKVPIVAVTAYATSGEAEKCLQCGMNDYISKPFAPDTLHNKIVAQLLLSGDETMIDSAVAEMDWLDLKQLDIMTDGDIMLKQRVISMIIEETPVEMEALQNSISKKDWNKVRATAHKMKSSINLFAKQDLVKLVKTIEKNAKENVNTENIPGLLAEVLEKTNLALEQLRQQH